MIPLSTPQEIAADIAREYREDNSRWTQGAYAKDSMGRPTLSSNPKAVCFCLAGAINRRFADDPLLNADLAKATYNAFDTALGFEPGSTQFIKWNDHPGRTVKQVITLCEKVAAS